MGVNDNPSWFHEGAGYAVYLINFASLLGFGWLLTKLSPDERHVVEESRLPANLEDGEARVTTGPALSPVLSRRTSWIVIALAIVTVAACWLMPKANEGDETGVVMNLPDEIAGLEGIPQPVSQAEHEILPPTPTFARKAYGPFSLPDFGLDRPFHLLDRAERRGKTKHSPARNGACPGRAGR